MTRAVVCVATTPHYQKGMIRLQEAFLKQRGLDDNMWSWSRLLPSWPTHQNVPYGFKAHALMTAATDDSPGGPADLLLWADASILPIRSLEPLWEKIERDGYWIARNGWNNYQWTADSAYPDLFQEELERGGQGYSRPWTMEEVRRANQFSIPHVVATSFGLNVKHPIGKAFLDEYYRLASETKAFCGPWTNGNSGIARTRYDGVRVAPCGPADVLGHRHDQTAASVIAWRLGMELTDCPEIFAYSKRRPDGTLHLSDQDERTILLADGAMHDGVVL